MEFFSCFAHGDQSDVVVLRMAAGEVADVIGQAVRLFPVLLARARLDGLIMGPAEFVSVRIEHFGDAVGVKDEAIIGSRDSERSPVILSNTSPLSIPTAMPGGFKIST